MSKILDQRILLLVISFSASVQSTKVLSEWKKCGDPECEKAMSRVQATTDYLGPDCRYLNFKTGEEIMVYSKLSRENENLWTGSKGKDFGYFPRDAVKVEEVFIGEEVEVLTKESDFLCLHEDKYVFENEDSTLYDHNKESEYSLSDAEPKLHENETLNYTKDSIQNEGRIESVSENDSEETYAQESANKQLVRKDDTEEPQTQNSLPLEPTQTQSSWISGWFTTESKNDEEPLKVVTESLEENKYQGRKIMVTDENDLQEPNDEEEQEPPAPGWFQGGLTNFLFFGEENEDVDLASEKNDPQIHDVSGVPEHTNTEQETPDTELLSEEEKSESQESKSNWFNLGLSNVLNFGHAEKDTIATEDQKSGETKDGANKNEEEQTLDQKESDMDKEPKETAKAVTEEDEENYAQEIIDSHRPNPEEIPASVHTVNDTKTTSNSTESSLDILTCDKEKPIEPYSSEEDLVSEIQQLKNTEAEKRNQESESRRGQSGWYTNIYNSFIDYNTDTLDNQQGHESIASDQISSSPSLPPNCDPSDIKHTEEKPDISEEESHFFSFRHFADILKFQSSTAKEEQVQSYGELPGTTNNHPGIKKTPCDSEPSLSLETPEKDKPVKGCNAQQNSASKSHFKMDNDVKEKIHKPENKNNPLSFYENNIKDFSQDIFNNEHNQKPGESQELTPDQPFSPQTSSSSFGLTGTKTSEESGHLEDMWSFRMEGVGRRKLLEETPEKKHEMNVAVDRELSSDQDSKGIAIASVNSEIKMDSSVADSVFDVKKPFSDAIQNYVPSNEGGWIYRILFCLNALEIRESMKSVLSAVISVIKKAVASLPEDMRPGPDLYGFPWEIVICAGIVGAFTILLFLYRSYQSVRSRLYVGRENQLANKIAELIDEKCKILEKLSLCKKEFEGLELSLKDGNIMKESTDTSFFEEMHEKLNKSNLELNQEIENLEKELEEEKSKQSENDILVAEIQERVESLENEEKSIQSQIDEAKSTLKVYQINTERLKTSLQDAVDENSHLQESEKQLLQEAEGWGERFSELNEQTKMFESSKADVEEVLKNKESQIKSLTQYILNMKDWSSAIREDDDTEDNHWDTDTKDDEQKRTVKKLIYAAKLNACLKTVEGERDQMYSKLSDENKAKEELTERIENLQSQQASLQSENERFESEVQKLQQKLKVMTELYQENEMKLHRKLTVEERERLQKEEKLSKVDEKINHAAEELNSYRERAKDLEEELERTIRSYENQITSHEKKAHDNWLTARAAERHLNDIKKENAHNRQKLTEAEFKLELLEKDPYALDVPVRPFVREHSPYGPSPMGRPSSETRAFLSPPTLLEGPLRLSPMLPGGGGGRGSRGPSAMYEAGSERGELISDRLTDPHRPPSDTGSLSPPWERERRIILPPPGEPYADPVLPPRRQERFFPNPPNTGRLSGPAELRTYNMQSFDKTDGQTSSEHSPRTEPSGDGMKDHSNLSNSVPDQSLVPESEAVSSGFVPPPFPPVRPPLMPVDPRAPPVPFMRRGPPFPPPPPAGMYGPRECFPVRDFGLPRPPLPIRNPFPMRPYPHYPPQRPGFLPPPPPPENRVEPPQSNPSAADQPEPQQET
ncbi:melanoma inhibitory activity protein 2 isoform X2 [Chiroxiphia lanceolata]|uniref:melanoma inhibitory activity protein 2 isoform X2 n=1 Tax=Chiroxiphia lanceolata TaxID=296741 RepID=UPI0013CE726C|nr:melanoma inhibitory activity protein 2 isoform X2 [Chiroxiphia lanceolata]